MGTAKSRHLLRLAKKSYAGGVGSPQRANLPLYITRGKGSRIWDVDGNEYIDYLAAFGPLVLGHQHPAIMSAIREQLKKGTMFGFNTELEIKLSQKVKKHVPCADLVRFVSSGSEAIQATIRVARAYTGKEKIIKFEGHYHGWIDSVLISRQPPEAVMGSRISPAKIKGSVGIPDSVLNDIIIAPWNDLDTLRKIVARHKNDVAAIITEPIMCNAGTIPPVDGFLKGLRELTERNDMLLIFDEVITGFRLALGGAQEYYGVVPDLAAFSKAIGGGVPISAFAGTEEVMEQVKEGQAFQPGTYNANPLCCAAALGNLTELEKNNGEAYRHMHRMGDRLAGGMREILEKRNTDALILNTGPLIGIHFTKLKNIRDIRDAYKGDDAKLKALKQEMVSRGVVLNPARFDSSFVSAVHKRQDIDTTLQAFEDSIKAIDRR
jgi:glutamate-1-semialdehyde 2,1-aminomutase